MRPNDFRREAMRFEDIDRAFSHEADDGPDDDPVTPPPCYGRDYPPDDPPATVTCSPCCGLDVTGREISDDETVAQCPGCKRIVEGCTVEVPVSVYETSSECVLAWIKAHQ